MLFGFAVKHESRAYDAYDIGADLLCDYLGRLARTVLAVVEHAQLDKLPRLESVAYLLCHVLRDAALADLKYSVVII